MRITYKTAFDAFSALKDIMSAKGLCGATQIKLVVLWRELAECAKTLKDADGMLISEYGTVGENGVVSFKDERKRGEFLKKREEMFSEEVDVNPILIRKEDAFWAASSPEALLLLDGLILFEEEKQ